MHNRPGNDDFILARDLILEEGEEAKWAEFLS